MNNIIEEVTKGTLIQGRYIDYVNAKRIKERTNKWLNGNGKKDLGLINDYSEDEQHVAAFIFEEVAKIVRSLLIAEDFNLEDVRDINIKIFPQLKKYLDSHRESLNNFAEAFKTPYMGNIITISKLEELQIFSDDVINALKKISYKDNMKSCPI